MSYSRSADVPISLGSGCGSSRHMLPAIAESSKKASGRVVSGRADLYNQADFSLASDITSSAKLHVWCCFAY
jgi:hypothetical protein